MAHRPAQFFFLSPRGALTLAALSASLMLTACASTSDLLPSSPFLASNDAKADTAAEPASELEKATEYWGKQYRSKPTDKTAALSYAKNLKASGQKKQAFDVLQDAASFHGSDKEVMSELGRLALEFDQLSMAARALEIADNPDKPDWKVISARGTVLAKQGQHKAAIPYFERALTLAPGQPSVVNNLAMAHAMSGDAGKAEEFLRQVANKDGSPSKVNQNLALVLGLQGKYDESKALAATAQGSSTLAAQNTDYLRRLTKLEPKASPVVAPTAVAATAPPAASKNTAPAASATPAAQATTAQLPWAAKSVTSTTPANSGQATVARVNDAFKPGAMDNSSTAAAWQPSVTADARTPEAAAVKGSSR